MGWWVFLETISNKDKFNLFWKGLKGCEIFNFKQLKGSFVEKRVNFSPPWENG